MCASENSSRRNCPLSWVLEGSSKPGDSGWVTLSEHGMDHTLASQPRKPATWQIRCPDGEFYHRFRVRMTGPSEDGKYMLGVSCLEFHGDLRNAVTKQM